MIKKDVQVLPCIYCKDTHPSTSCPLYVKALARIPKIMLSENFAGESPTPFIGRYGYPHVQVGFLSIPDQKDTSMYDNPRGWSQGGFSTEHIVRFRQSMINAETPQYVTASSSHIDFVQQVGLASRPVDVEVLLKKKPRPSLSFDEHSPPFGPRGSLAQSRITSNPFIPTPVERVVSDTDRKAASSLQYLYGKGFDEHYLTKVLSIGAVGLKKNRKLVPTRWSITATDDLLGKDLLKSIKDYSFADIFLFEGDYLGNYYYFLFFPKPFSYELFELYLPAFRAGKEQYATDYESFHGRTTYAAACAGGYYSVRLALVEHLQNMKRQSAVLTIRVITEDYTTPLGVWVTREAARKGLSSPPLSFGSQELLLQYVRQRIARRHGIAIETLMKKSKLLHSLRQKDIHTWISHK